MILGPEAYPILLLANTSRRLSKACLLPRKDRIDYLARHTVVYCYSEYYDHLNKKLLNKSYTVKFIFNVGLLSKTDYSAFISKVREIHGLRKLRSMRRIHGTII